MNDINIMPLIMAFVIMAVILGGITIVSHIYSLNRIKSKTVGDGQHGTARLATKAEIRRAYEHIIYTPKKWRKEAQKGVHPSTSDGKALPQGLLVGRDKTGALIDTGDVHALMIGAAGVGKCNNL